MSQASVVNIIDPYRAVPASQHNGVLCETPAEDSSVSSVFGADRSEVGRHGRESRVALGFAGLALTAVALAGCGGSPQQPVAQVPSLAPGNYSVSHQVGHDTGSFNNWGKSMDACVFGTPNGDYTVMQHVSAAGWTMQTVTTPQGQTYTTRAVGAKSRYKSLDADDGLSAESKATLRTIARLCQESATPDAVSHTTVKVER